MPLSASNAREEENNLLTMLRQWSPAATKGVLSSLFGTMKTKKMKKVMVTAILISKNHGDKRRHAAHQGAASLL
jgi:hypothetical protein